MSSPIESRFDDPSPENDAGYWQRHATYWRDKAREMRAELDRRHKEYASALNRRVDVENVLAQVAAGKRDMLTRDECRELAIKLGVSPK